jgi:hypothetical protein
MIGPNMERVVRAVCVGLMVCVLCIGVAAAKEALPEPNPASRIVVSDCNIQAAIDNCAGECTIFVSPGTCALAATLHWAGTGKRINLECASTSETILTWPVGVNGIAPDSNSRIANCDLRGPNVAAPATSIIASGTTTDVVIEGNIIEQSCDPGIDTGGSSMRWSIRDNLVKNNIGDGLFLASGTSDSIVSDNVIIGNGSNGIDCNCSGTTIHGNVVKSNGLPGGTIDKNGILVSGIFGGDSANYNSVTGNETSFNGGSGISIRADFGTTANYNVVSGNVSHDNGGSFRIGDGIQLDGSDLGNWTGNAIVGNTIYNNTRFGIVVDGQNAVSVEMTLISSNTVVGNANTGVLFGGPKVADTLVVNNIVVNNTQAQIVDNGSTRAVVGGNKENTIDSSFVINGGLVASTITAQASNIVISNSHYVEAQSAGTGSQSLLLGLDGSNQTILRGGGGPNSLLIQTSTGSEGASMTDAGTWNFPGGMTIGRGISPDGSGLKHQSVQTGPIHASSSAMVILTWATAFADSNYDPQCALVDSTESSDTIRIHHIESFGPSSVSVLITNDDHFKAHSGTLHCLGIHQ